MTAKRARWGMGIGVAAGAGLLGLVGLLDKTYGRRRRALLRDRLARSGAALVDRVRGRHVLDREDEPTFAYARRSWSPAARVAAGAAGLGLLGWGVRRRGPLGWLAGLAGAGLAARGATNVALERLLGLGEERPGFDVRKALTVNAVVDDVFDFWSNVENFPRFMAHVREVRDVGNGRTHWVVDGPAGAPVSWDAVRTARIKNQLLAWKSVPGSAVESSGFVIFDPTPEGGTRVQVRMSYRPPAGEPGPAVGALLGRDPLRPVHDDLLRFKSLSETGKTAAPDDTVREEEIAAIAPPETDAVPAAAGRETPGEPEPAFAPTEEVSEEGAKPATRKRKPRARRPPEPAV